MIAAPPPGFASSALNLRPAPGLTWTRSTIAVRTPEICQSQSVNIFLPGDVDKWDLHMLHWLAWERGVKSLYYLRSKSIQRAAFAGGDGVAAMVEKAAGERTDYDECLACQ